MSSVIVRCRINYRKLHDRMEEIAIDLWVPERSDVHDQATSFPHGRLSLLITLYRVIESLVVGDARSTLIWFPQKRSIPRLYSVPKLFSLRYVLKDLHGIYSRLCSPPSRNKRHCFIYSSFIVMADLQRRWHDFFSFLFFSSLSIPAHISHRNYWWPAIF